MNKDYKKLYEEALERARLSRLQLLNIGEEATEIEYIFPELKELENERIRKYIIWHLKHTRTYPDNSINNHVEEAIAWLEKQKKSDALINTTSEMEYAKNYSYDVWEKLMSKFNAIAGYRIGCNDVSDIVLNAILNAFEWQNKQKPIEQDTETHDLWVYIREWNDKFGRLPKDEDELAACIDFVMKRQKPRKGLWDAEKVEKVLGNLLFNKEEKIYRAYLDYDAFFEDFRKAMED